MSKPLLVFDMDGVLVDVTQSYRETIARTVEHYTGTRIPNDLIQDFKNQGGWNDDWKLSHHLITGVGIDVPFEEMKAHFQSIFLGDGSDGMILREEWIARPGSLEKLGERFRFGVFTGRPRGEAALTLERFGGDLRFDPIVAMEDVEHPKPAPEGLLKIAAANPDAKIYYVGDSIDDARSARAASIPFIGIAAPGNPRYVDLAFLFQQEGAYAIVDDINYLEEVFPA